jgi:hypothetical protein
VARAARGKAGDMVCMGLMQLDFLGVRMDKQAEMAEIQAMEALEPMVEAQGNSQSWLKSLIRTFYWHSGPFSSKAGGVEVQVLMEFLLQEAMAGLEGHHIPSRHFVHIRLTLRSATYYTNDRWHVRTHTNPGGRNGVRGLTSVARPHPGRDGPNGAVHIFVQKADSKLDAPFPSAYWLEVVNFDIVDANNDGILEFGEEINLQNLRVCNKGRAKAYFSPDH